MGDLPPCRVNAKDSDSATGFQVLLFRPDACAQSPDRTMLETNTVRLSRIEFVPMVHRLLVRQGQLLFAPLLRP